MQCTFYIRDRCNVRRTSKIYIMEHALRSRLLWLYGNLLKVAKSEKSGGFPVQLVNGNMYRLQKFRGFVRALIFVIRASRIAGVPNLGWTHPQGVRHVISEVRDKEVKCSNALIIHFVSSAYFV